MNKCGADRAEGGGREKPQSFHTPGSLVWLRVAWISRGVQEVRVDRLLHPSFVIGGRADRLTAVELIYCGIRACHE